jgi:hypothetical protein
VRPNIRPMIARQWMGHRDDEDGKEGKLSADEAIKRVRNMGNASLLCEEDVVDWLEVL